MTIYINTTQQKLGAKVIRKCLTQNCGNVRGRGGEDELRDYTSVFCLVNGDNASLPCL